MIAITHEPFGTTKDGKAVTRYILKNSGGMRVSVLSYGCTVQSICVPDKNGELRDVVLGYDTLRDYENGNKIMPGSPEEKAYYASEAGAVSGKEKTEEEVLEEMRKLGM